MKPVTSQTLPLLVLLLAWATAAGAEEGATKEGEELPKAEGWRAPRPPPPGRSRFGSGPSYDLEKAYDSMSNNRAANRNGYSSSSSSGSSSGSYSKNRGSSGSYSGSSGGYSSGSSGGGYSSNERYSDDLYRDAGYSDDEQYSAYASASDYGGYGSDSGYGYSMTKYVDCNSAIALLSLILFIDILRDVVQQITNPNRRRRGASTPDEEDLLEYGADGGAGALAEGLPQLIVPLLRNLSEASREAPPEDSCIQRPLCEANAALTHRYGALGRVVGAFVSNVAARALVGSDPPRYQLALEASQRGRASREGAEPAFCAAQFPCLGRDANATSLR
ncbi:uncharacterized protein [Penaeus vannamei]|uniref:uncharacterized protein isoform X2 n=1 Tax=Penaeus vannamei TaxID=6689 RepID=UPI00387F7FFE